MTNPTSVPTKRIEHIDIAKGISILLVALNHSALTQYLAELSPFLGELSYRMSIFRMPLFFFMSGVFFSYAASFYPFIKKRLNALLKPYFTVAIAVAAIMFCIEGDFKARLFSFLYGNATIIKGPWGPMWFLPHLFVVHLFSYLIFRLTPFQRLHSVARWLVVAVMLVVGFFVLDFFSEPITGTLAGMYIHVWGLPFSLDIALISVVYFIAGNLLKEQIKVFRLRVLWLVVVSIALLLILLLIDVYVDLAMRSARNQLLAVLGAAFGIYVVLGLSKLIEKSRWIKRLLLAAGGASLFILIFHMLVENVLMWLIPIEGWSALPRLLASAVFFLLCVFIPVGMKWCVQRSKLLAALMLPTSQQLSAPRAKLSPA